MFPIRNSAESFKPNFEVHSCGYLHTIKVASELADSDIHLAETKTLK
jgi:hypothetical protein